MIQHFLQSCWQNYPGPSATLHSSYEPCAVTPALLLHSCSAPASLLDPPCTLCSPGKIRQLTVWPGLPFSETTRSSRLPLPALPSLFSLHLSLFLSLSLSLHLSRFLSLSLPLLSLSISPASSSSSLLSGSSIPLLNPFPGCSFLTPAHRDITTSSFSLLSFVPTTPLHHHRPSNSTANFMFLLVLPSLQMAADDVICSCLKLPGFLPFIVRSFSLFLPSFLSLSHLPS